MPVRHFLHAHFEEVVEGRARLARADLPAAGQASQSVADLGVDEGRSPDPVLPADRVFGRLTVLARTQELDHHGGVDDVQNSPRASRMISTMLSDFTFVGPRASTRAAISSNVRKPDSTPSSRLM